MTISLHHALVPTWIQMLGSLEGLLDKAMDWCEAQGCDQSEVLDARLAPDMLDFAYQVKSAWVHSLGAVEAVRAGAFSPDRTEAPRSLDALRAGTGAVIGALRVLDPEEFEDFMGSDLTFSIGSHEWFYEGHEFLLSFSLPNFFFHVNAAYAILRHLGLEIGKRDYLGAAREKAA